MTTNSSKNSPNKTSSLVNLEKRKSSEMSKAKSVVSDVPTKEFYGNGEFKSNGVFSSLIRRRKVSMLPHCTEECHKIENYKSCADKLHKALMFVLVENKVYAKNLGALEVPVVQMDPVYSQAAAFLKQYEKIQSLGRKGTYESLESAIAGLQKMSQYRTKYVRKQLDNLRPFTAFIGQEYWEYVRLRKAYWDALEEYDNALTLHNKERTMDSEKNVERSQQKRNAAADALVEYIKTILNVNKKEHVKAIVKFADEASDFHRQMSEFLSGVEPKEKQQASSVAKLK